MASADLIFMPDYGADPIWSADRNYMVELERLPIGESLRGRIREWARRWEDVAWRTEYDDVVNGMRPGPAVPVPEATHEAIDRQGRLLCEELRAELGGDWRVAYATFPDGRHLQWEIGGPVRPG
jgi:hypothetical protein